MAIFCDTKWVSADGSLAAVFDNPTVPRVSNRNVLEYDRDVFDEEAVAPPPPKAPAPIPQRREIPKAPASSPQRAVPKLPTPSPYCEIPKVPTRSWEKSTKSALCIIPPESVWDQIQAIRCDHDKAYKRWMPHINLLFPFVSDKTFADASRDIQTALASMKPFTVHFSKRSLGYFLRAKNCTLWLQPLEEQFAKTPNRQGLSTNAKSSAVLPHHPRVIELQKIVESIFPECADLSAISEEGGFQPHLSLGQFPASKVKTTCDMYQKTWMDFSFEVKEIHLISRVDFHDPFHIRRSVPLGVRR